MDDSQNASTENDENEQSGSRRKGGCGCLIAVLIFLMAGGGISAYLGATFALRQETSLEPEAVMADLAKRWIMVPGEFADRRMPDKYKEAAHVNSGKELFGAQCSMCHGRTGKGDSDFGKAMFPPAVALTLDRTQTKSDGQLFWLIAHGINYTGMPAWGTEYGGPNDQEDIWNMVSYIRSIKDASASK